MLEAQSADRQHDRQKHQGESEAYQEPKCRSREMRPQLGPQLGNY